MIAAALAFSASPSCGGRALHSVAHLRRASPYARVRLGGERALPRGRRRPYLSRLESHCGLTSPRSRSLHGSADVINGSLRSPVDPAKSIHALSLKAKASLSSLMKLA